MRFRILLSIFFIVSFCVLYSTAHATQYKVSIEDDQILLNGKEIKIIGLRCSNGLITDQDTSELIKNLKVFKTYGVNTVSVFFMGSRFGDIKGYNPDCSLNPKYTKRMARIIEAADQEGMIVLVGCLYWSTSKAKEDLQDWNQKDANQAVANTVRWLSEHDYRNVIVDPDNEGMASRQKDWDTGKMIEAGHAVDSSIMIGYNNKPEPPESADVLLHFSPKDGKRPFVESEGTPTNAPQGYWGKYSKEDGYYNYIRIGRYTEAMKENQIKISKKNIEEQNGYLFASTWLQCGQKEGIGGPFMNPGGLAKNNNINEHVKTIQDDAGIRWWLNWVRETYGPWEPPK